MLCYPEVKEKKRGYSKGSHSLAWHAIACPQRGRQKNVVAADNAKFMSMD